MIYLWASLLVVVNAFWLALTLLMLPGNWMMVATTALVAWWQWDKGMFSPWTLAAIVALAAAGEVLEFLSSALGVRKAGGTRWAALASLAGAAIGAAVGTFAIPVPVLGSLLGVCVGACAGAWACEAALGRSLTRSAKVSLAAGAGRLLGTIAKLLIGTVIWLIVAAAAFWP